MYSYGNEKANLFTEDGQVAFMQGRDAAKQMLKETGAFRLQEWMARNRITGDSWLQLAIIDRMVELKELVPLRDAGKCWSQYQVYTDPQVHNL